jgi:methyl-accepting chemotaxis protein
MSSKFNPSQPNATKRNVLHSLRGKLILMLLGLSLIPTLTVGVISYLNSRAALERQINQDLELTASLQADSIEQWVNDRVKDIQTVASMGQVQDMDPDEASDTLMAYRDQWKVYETIFLAGKDGKTIVNTDGGQQDISKAAYFADALQGKMTITPPKVSRTTGNLILVLAVPVERDGKVVGVLGFTVPTEFIGNLLAQARLGDSGDAYLVNADGFFLTPSRFEKELLASGAIKERSELELQIDTFATQEMNAGRTGTAKYTDYRGNRVIGSYIWLPDTGWGIIIEQGQSEAFSESNTLLRTMIAISAFVLLIVAALAFLIAQSIAMPVRAMAGVAMKLANGEIHQEVNYKSLDEVGELADSFRAMIACHRGMTESAERIADGDLTVQVQVQS